MTDKSLTKPRGKRPKGLHIRCIACGKYRYVGPYFMNSAKYCSRKCAGTALLTTDVERAQAFWSKVDKSAGEQACWIWNGAVTTHGYGCVAHKGRVLGAHKVAYLISKGDVPQGLQVRHSCDKPLCVNPSHLSIGTLQDNMADKVARGRTQKENPHKLNLEAAREIRRLRGTSSSGELSQRFGVTQSHVFAIWANRIWKEPNEQIRK